jgi:hypothetical protein
MRKGLFFAWFSGCAVLFFAIFAKIVNSSASTGNLKTASDIIFAVLSLVFAIPLSRLIDLYSSNKDDYKEMINDTKHMLIPVFNSRDVFVKKVPLEKLILPSTKKMIFLHTTASNLVGNYDYNLKKMLEKVDVEIFVLKADCEPLKIRSDELTGKETVTLLDDAKNNKSKFIDFSKTVSDKKYKKLTVYEYENIPYFSAIIAEENNKQRRLYITQHFFEKHARECPTFYIDSEDEIYEICNDSVQIFLDKNRRPEKIIAPNGKKETSDE